MLTGKKYSASNIIPCFFPFLEYIFKNLTFVGLEIMIFSGGTHGEKRSMG
jgi:hypothetical protein